VQQYQSTIPVQTILNKNANIHTSASKKSSRERDQAKTTAKSNQLISQYLNQVTINVSKQKPDTMNTSLLQRQARNSSSTKSPNGVGQISRANRVQMNYNLHSSKTLGGPASQLSVNLLPNSSTQFFTNPL
jgi:hypothetical protein